MLVELRVKNFAIIDELCLSFQAGFNILSGETGAGKSVLLKSLSLLMGAKGSSDLVRDKAEYALIEGHFDISQRPDIQQQLIDMGIESTDEDFIVRRLLGRNGKSKVYMNSSLCGLADLNRVVHPLIQITGTQAPLIEITGQHESKNLLDRSYHLDLVDLYADLLARRNELTRLYHFMQELEQQCGELQAQQHQNEQKLDFLQYQIREIEAMELQEGEEEQLENQYRKLKNWQKWSDFLFQQRELLEDSDYSALSRIQKAQSSLQKALSFDPALEKIGEHLMKAEDYLSEYLHELNQYAASHEDSEQNLFAVEERLSQFRKLQKKYGHTSAEILASLEAFRNERERLENFEQLQEEQQKQLQQSRLQYKALASELRQLRKKAAQNFVRQVNKELKDLNMNGFEFSIELSTADKAGPKGEDVCEFRCKTAAAEPARPLQKTASGGELSRILLAIKQVLGSKELARTYLFDEVDSGVSGETAEKVGRKLRAISQGQQLICVTHLPQVAAQAEHHYRIEKQIEKKRASMQVQCLTGQQRIEEIARLISGEKRTASSLRHAKELLQLFHP